MYTASSIKGALSGMGLSEADQMSMFKQMNMMECLFRAQDVELGFGKYKGKCLSEVYEMDPWYITQYLAKNDFVQTQTTRLKEAVDIIVANHKE